MLICGFALVTFAIPAISRGDEATAISQLAANLKPGEWAELHSTGYDSATLMRGDDILAYSGKAAWDSVTQQVFFMGQVHLKGPPSFIAYGAKDNTWRKQPTPQWAESLKWFHAYENNAADSAGGNFYHHSSNSGLVHRYNTAKQEWSTLPELSAPTGHGTAIEYFPELKGLVRVLQGEVWFWSEEKQAWSVLTAKLEMGPYHHFASYSQPLKLVMLGGGNDSRAIHLLSAEGIFTRGKDSPVDLGIGRSLNVVDPVSGELLVLTKEAKFWAYNPAKNSWRSLSTAGLPFPQYTGHSLSAVSLSNHGVVLFFSSQPLGMKTLVYKHATESK